MYFHFVLFSRAAKKKVKEKIPTENFSIFSYCKKKKTQKTEKLFSCFLISLPGKTPVTFTLINAFVA